jgi:hypothetical protein
MRTHALALAASVSLASSAAAEIAWVTHDLTLSLQQSTSASGFTPHKNVVRFLGVGPIAITDTDTGQGLVSNPTYDDKGREVRNPLYSGREAGNPEDQLEIEGIALLTLTLSTPTFHLKSPGIVHRDLAARNVLLRTVNGDYMSSPLDELTFGSDGPMDFRATEGAQPIVWTSPQARRLYYNGDANSPHWIDIEIGSALSTGIVPAPGTVMILAGWSVIGGRRRR